jgi:hypothetical protein
MDWSYLAALINWRNILWGTLEQKPSARSGKTVNTMISGAKYWAIEKELGYAPIVLRG